MGWQPGNHTRLAQDFAKEAIELARQTKNRRLLAYTYIWQGLTYGNRFFSDLESARACYDQAVRLSKGVHADGAWDDLQTLKTRVLRAGSVYPTLRAWSQGAVGDKTFQQITEEFCRVDHPQGLGTGGPEGLSGGDAAFDLSQESTPHFGPGRTKKIE